MKQASDFRQLVRDAVLDDIAILPKFVEDQLRDLHGHLSKDGSCLYSL